MFLKLAYITLDTSILELFEIFGRCSQSLAHVDL